MINHKLIKFLLLSNNIKYNNVIAYLVFLIISEVNSGQILNFKDDKRCNYFLFSKVSNQLFEGLYIRLNQKEKTLITKMPLFCYVLLYKTKYATTN